VDDANNVTRATGAMRSLARDGLPLWDDAVPVQGYDGTVRLIPREAAQAGPESPLWPVADGVPGRVARLRCVGNAIVPQCAFVIFQRIAAVMARAAAPERVA
jgi:hypothetical protein